MTITPGLLPEGLRDRLPPQAEAARRAHSHACRSRRSPDATSATLTLDPTERHGFEYQSWIGFSLFGRGLSGEVGRGGSYAVLHPGGREEAAVGFSLYIDPLVDAGLGVVERRHVFLPVGTEPAAGAALRAEGWTTIAALSEADDPAALGCTHRLVDGRPAAI
jgi:ATP phosphoribosyltransferase regulatory subunit